MNILALSSCLSAMTLWWAIVGTVTVLWGGDALGNCPEAFPIGAVEILGPGFPLGPSDLSFNSWLLGPPTGACCPGSSRVGSLGQALFSCPDLVVPPAFRSCTDGDGLGLLV